MRLASWRENNNTDDINYQARESIGARNYSARPLRSDREHFSNLCPAAAAAAA